MGVINVQIDDELDQEFRLEILRSIGRGKGAIKLSIEEAIRLWLKKRSKKSGSIPKSMFSKGLELCEKNAKRLIQEADETFRHGFHTAAFILGFTAWEEVGKAFLFLQNWEEYEILREKWRNKFIDHVDKIRVAKGFVETSRFKNFIRSSPRAHDLFFPEGKDETKIKVIINKEYAKNVFNWRNSVLFVDFNFNKKKFESPMDFVNPTRSSKMIGSAKDSLDVLQIIKREIDICSRNSQI